LEKLLEQQKKKNPRWSKFVEPSELILKQGYVNKKKGLFARKRMLLLTNTPRLIYIDATSNVKKGEIPFTEKTFTEAKTFKIFFIHTVRSSAKAERRVN
jgi:3-phosphoinositide dependent protein kinase-1